MSVLHRYQQTGTESVNYIVRTGYALFKWSSAKVIFLKYAVYILAIPNGLLKLISVPVPIVVKKYWNY
jgi:hypothetical protein